MKTVTEALSEIKLIEKKIENKKTVVLQNLTRFEQMPDPLGDGKEATKREVQAIEDLYTRLTTIRSKIAEANLKNTISVGSQTNTIYGWLVWKREVSDAQAKFYKGVSSGVKSALDQNAQRPQVFKSEQGDVKLSTLICNLSYQDFITKEQDTRDLIENLDGQLSLKNATIVIDI